MRPLPQELAASLDVYPKLPPIPSSGDLHMSATRRRTVDQRATLRLDDGTLQKTVKWKASYATAQDMEMLMDKGRKAREQETNERVARACPPEAAPELSERLMTDERRAAVGIFVLRLPPAAPPQPPQPSVPWQCVVGGTAHSSIAITTNPLAQVRFQACNAYLTHHAIIQK